MRPRLLDCFCGAGGATRGFQIAGFYVVGVDNRPQPNYCGDEFIQADALEVLACLADPDPSEHYEDWLPATKLIWPFVAINAGPPCQLYTKAQRIQGNDHPDLIGPTREWLEATGLPYIIENVPGASLIDPVVLEGQMFEGLGTVRPRWFETNWPLEIPFLRLSRPRQAKMGRAPKAGEWMQVVGHFTDAAAGRRAMGIDWMTRDELREAIPPAYTAAIGAQLLDHLSYVPAARNPGGGGG